MNREVPPPYHQGRILVSVAFVLTMLILLATWPASHDDASGPTPPPPVVKVELNRLVVSWAPRDSGAPESIDHDLRTEPYGVRCVSAGAQRCVVDHPSSSSDLRFSVRLDVGGSWTPWSAVSAPIPRTPIVIVAGQSNATGWESPVKDSSGQDLLAAGSSPGDTAVRISWDQPTSMLYERVGLGADQSVSLVTPQVLKPTVTSSARGTAVFGPEISLARTLSRSGQPGLLVLKVAQTGTRLGQSGPWSAPNGSLYRSLVSDAQFLIRREAQHGRLATVVAMNWFQGESDSEPGLAEAYQANLTTLISSLRRDIPSSASTPFVIAMTSNESWVRFQRSAKICAPAACEALFVANNTVREADHRVAATVPHVSVVDTVLLSHAPGGLHVDSTGELTLGTMLAEADRSVGLT